MIGTNFVRAPNYPLRERRISKHRFGLISTSRLHSLPGTLASMNIALVDTHGCHGLITSRTLLRTLARTCANPGVAICGNCFAARRSSSSKGSVFPCECSTTDITVTQTATNSAENGYR